MDIKKAFKDLGIENKYDENLDTTTLQLIGMTELLNQRTSREMKELIAKYGNKSQAE